MRILLQFLRALGRDTTERYDNGPAYADDAVLRNARELPYMYAVWLPEVQTDPSLPGSIFCMCVWHPVAIQ